VSPRLRLLVGVLAALAIAGAGARPAAAHAYLVRSMPAYGTSLRGSPPMLRLEFSESVAAGLSRVTLVGAKTGSVGPLRVTSAGPSALAVGLPRLRPDLYRVAWRTVSENDLHPTAGTVVFGVDTAAPGGAPRQTAGGNVTPSPLEVTLRWLDFLAVSLVVGPLGLLALVVPGAARRGVPDLGRVRAALLRLVLRACLAALATGIGLLLVQSDRAGGVSAVGRVVLHTGYGHHWLGRQLVLVALADAVLAAAVWPRSRVLRSATLLGAVALMVPLAQVSHAAALRGEWSAAALVLALHLLTAAAWTGGVASLVVGSIVLRRAGQRGAGRALALAFGRYAAVSVALIAITGVAELGIHVESLTALVHTGYGATLLVKTALFVVAGTVGLATTAGLHGWRVPPRVRGWWQVAPRFEALALALVLVPAAVLTASAPARNWTPASRIANGAEKSGGEWAAYARDLVLDVAVEPNRPGRNFVTVGVYNTRRPAPGRIDAVRLRVGGSRPLALSPAGGSEWQAVMNLRQGRASFSVDVQRPGLPVARGRAEVTVAAASSSAPAPVTPPRGLADRRLEPLLGPLALGGALLLALVLVLEQALRRLRRLRRRRLGAVAGELRPRRVEP
jgi:copper transport protein